MKLEDDSDIHLVVTDPRDRRLTMIVEFPNASCTRGASRQARAKMRNARSHLVAACGSPTSSFTSLSGKATISGVGFFDQLHGQTGVAPNGIELHPAVGLTQLTCRRCRRRTPAAPARPHLRRRRVETVIPSYPTVCIPPAAARSGLRRDHVSQLPGSLGRARSGSAWFRRRPRSDRVRELVGSGQSLGELHSSNPSAIRKD